MGNMTKPAQFILLIFALFFIIAGLIKLSDKGYASFTVLEGSIIEVKCPRKFNAVIKLSDSDKEYYLADKFKTVTGCRKPTKAERLLGKVAELTVAGNGDITSLNLDNKPVYSLSDVNSESKRIGSIMLLVGVALIILVIYKRNAT